MLLYVKLHEYNLLSNNNTNAIKIKSRTRLPPSLFLTNAVFLSRLFPSFRSYKMQSAILYLLWLIRLWDLFFFQLDHLTCILFSFLIHPALTRHKPWLFMYTHTVWFSPPMCLNFQVNADNFPIPLQFNEVCTKIFQMQLSVHLKYDLQQA
jgi:hypothetical protein